MDGMSGGDKLMEHLQSIAKGLSSGDDLKVGFLEGAKYPDGTPVALVAATNLSLIHISEPTRPY